MRNLLNQNNGSKEIIGMKSKDWSDIGNPDIGLTIGDPNIGLTVGDPNIALTVSQDTLKDDFYKKHKRLTKKQLTDAMYELEVENIGLKVKMGIYDNMFKIDENQNS